jgi:hypothetical protein
VSLVQTGERQARERIRFRRKGGRRATPKKAKAQGSNRRRLELNTPVGREGLSGGAKPRGRAGRLQKAGFALPVCMRRLTACGSARWKRRGTAGEEKAPKGATPGAPSA